MTEQDPQIARNDVEGGREDLRRGSRKLVIGLVLLVVVIAAAVALTRLFGSNDSSGGPDESLRPVPPAVELVVP